MDRWNYKHIGFYLAAVLIVIVIYLLPEAWALNSGILQAYEKFLFAAPVLFIVASFLSMKISESGLVFISLAFLFLTLSEQVMGLVAYLAATADAEYAGHFLLSAGLWRGFIAVLPFILTLNLSIVFLLPEKIGRFQMVTAKAVFLAAPVLFLLKPDFYPHVFMTEAGFNSAGLPLPALLACFLPVAAPYIYHSRRARSFSPALVANLILFMLPELLPMDQSLRETGYMFAGIILLHSLYRVYWENSYIDELTGLYNRRALDERMQRLRGKYSLAMVDVDHFKNFNDTYGHDEGDNVLRLVGKTLFSHFGTAAYRYGGEEFCVVFRKGDAGSSAPKLDRARQAIEDKKFAIRKKTKSRKKSGRKKGSVQVKRVQLTFSAGIADSTTTKNGPVEILKLADKALYRAKENGRNRVVSARGK